VDQIRGKGDVGRGKAEYRADQHRHLLVAQAQRRLLEVEKHGRIKIDYTLLAVIAGELFQDEFVKGGGAVDALYASLYQLVQVADGCIEIHRRVDQHHALEIEALPRLVQLADKGGVECAKAIAGEVELGDRQIALLCPDRLHDPVQILRVLGAVTRRGEARSGGDEVEAGGR